MPYKLYGVYTYDIIKTQDTRSFGRHHVDDTRESGIGLQQSKHNTTRVYDSLQRSIRFYFVFIIIIIF